MNRIIYALDAIIGPLPEEVSTAISEAPATFDSIAGLLIPTLALVAIAAFGIILYANNKKADLFVSIHNNSMPKNYSGTMLLYNASKISKNKDLAESFQEIVGKASKLPGIGARSREDLAVLKHINMPGVLVEVACMSNIKDRRELRKESFKQNIAQGIYEAIVKATV